ncbi:SDR family oxidoreductase [uncultured Microscilla sp.]|uniref:SDR family oxidoreductase n=1 Tax=uncultured Microscilla sp. TaxID=432653 RepID=UPI002607C1FA|nr:SDR family oxidoreductase [uncultured Microscilla sp.]
MNIFMTGATGYIGRLLAQKLAEQGHTIHALCRSSSQTGDLQHPNIKFFEGDLLDSHSIDRAMASCQQAYHLAAFAKVFTKQPELHDHINVDGTMNVLAAAQKAGVQRTVFTSTGGVFGFSTPDQPVDEATPRNIEFFNHYERTKTEAEEKIRELTAQGQDIVIVNPTRVYGPGLLSESNAATRLMQLYYQGKWKMSPGDGTKLGNYVYVNDVVNGHILAMEKGRAGERYIIGGINASYKQLFDTLGKYAPKKLKLINAPVWLMMIVSNFELAKAKLFNMKPLITPKYAKKYTYHWGLSSAKAEKELGYEITSLDEGIRQTMEWLAALENNNAQAQNA